MMADCLRCLLTLKLQYGIWQREDILRRFIPRPISGKCHSLSTGRIWRPSLVKPRLDICSKISHVLHPRLGFVGALWVTGLCRAYGRCSGCLPTFTLYAARIATVFLYSAVNLVKSLFWQGSMTRPRQEDRKFRPDKVRSECTL